MCFPSALRKLLWLNEKKIGLRHPYPGSLVKSETKAQLTAVSIRCVASERGETGPVTEAVMKLNVCISESFLVYFYRKPP